MAMLVIILIGALDQMTVGVALPSIATSLGRLEGVAWVISAYLVAATVVTPLFGKFGDVYGQRPLLSVAMAIFLAGSVACALSHSLPVLVAARIVQGMGAGGLAAMSQAIIARVVPLRVRGRFQSQASMAWGSASVLGPLLGGALAQYLSWRWIFWLNVPAAVLAWWLAVRALRSDPEPTERPPVDWLGAALLLALLVAGLMPLTRAGEGTPLLDAANGAWAAAAVVLLGGFAWRQQRAASPILPLGVLARNAALVRGCSLLFVAFFVFVGMSVLVPLRLQLAGGVGASAAGAQLMWFTLAVPATVFFAGRWMLRHARTRPLQRAGACVVPLALGALIAVDPAHTPALRAGLVALGVGIGLQVPSAMIMVQGHVARSVLGTATALTSFFRALGGAVGAAALAGIVFAMPRVPGTQGPADAAFAAAMAAALALSLASAWIAWRVPDTRLDG